MYAHTTWPPPGPKAPHPVGAPIPGVRAAAGSTTPAAPLPVCAATGPRFLGRWGR
ncbi:hypothetical protein [Streptomyces sp. NPDC096351]|uniref:hypothetical protein n=1 Tax=Streptomyces sp. NPDC096351 TaxID=3366087 RepID=UPI0037F698F4